jgi:histidine kinase/DNA gyrase B/HSP90-like ATPase
MGQGPQAWLLGRLDALLSEKQRRSSPEEPGHYRVVGAVLFLLVLDAVLVVTAPLFPASSARMRVGLLSGSGVGSSPEHLSRLFVHGFTTKKDGHGFGLHASALAAEELDGRLRCTSDGPGQGATFIIELPLRGQEARA